MSTVRDIEVHVSASRLVHAPVARAYAAYVDPTLMRRWMGNHPIIVTKGPLDRRGATFSEAIIGPYRSHTDVLAAEPPALHEMMGRGIFGLGYRWTAHFAEVHGGTLVRLDAAVILPLHLVGRAVRRLLAPVAVQSRIEHRLAIFAEEVEGRAARDTRNSTAQGG
jgi:hypothetical protein